mgnify:CR=1 FL=1
MTARPNETYLFTVADGFGQRLDIWLGDRLEISRSQLKRLVDQHLVTVNGVTAKAGYRVELEDQITVIVPPDRVPSLEAESIPLEIIYEDRELAIVNKPKGLVVHPGARNLDGTLVNALLFHLDELADGGEAHRPGIVHRLDKDTSGLMMIAKTNASYSHLTEQLKEGRVARHYLALVQGVMPSPEGIIDEPLGRHPKDRKKMAVVATGRHAQTVFQVQEYFCRHSLVLCRLVTGRTHQIRVHLSSIHHPLVGDPLYGLKRNNLGAKSQVLHATYLAFQHPCGQSMEFRSEPDCEFLRIVEKARQVN